MRIHPTVPYRVDETPASLVSRLAFRHRTDSTRIFSLDMGWPFQAIVNGDPAALADLADLVGISVEPLADAAIVRTSDAFSLRDQQLAKPMLRRARTVICPRCLAEDLRDIPQPWMASGRVQWQLDPIRTCHLHHVALTEIAVVNSPNLMNDFARLAAPWIDEIRRLADAIDKATPSSMEAYLLERLDGAAGPTWLDALPWHAAAKTCEMIGAVALFGRKAAIKTMSDAQWREAGGVGFEIASAGPSGIRSFLDGLRSSYDGSSSDSSGPQAWFGRLHTWLSDTRLPGFDPMRDIVIEMVGELEPVGADDRLYGRPIVERRRLHSIRTAALETGMHPKRLRKILASSGVVPPDHHQWSNDRVIFSATEAEDVLARATHAISEQEAQTYLNAGRVQTRLLVEHGLIRPIIACDEKALRPIYDTRELDAFLANLTARAKEVESLASPAFRINDAAKRSNCSAMEVVQAILDGRLGWVGRVAGETGYLSVLVDVTEVRDLVRGDHGNRLTLARVQSELNTTFAVVDALVRTGILPSERAVSPVNRCPYTAVQRDDLNRFAATYGSLNEIARERATHFSRIKKALGQLGVQPAFGKPQVPATFYRRADIPLDL